MVSVRYASDTCLRLEAFENKHSTTVTYSTWDYRRNTSIQVCSIVKVLRIGLRLFYHSRTVVVARCTCGTRNVQKRSRISVPPPLHTQHGNVDEITQYRTVVVARCASDTCFRLEAFENKHSTTVTYSTWDYSRNGSIQMLSIVLVLRIVLRLFCLSRTGIEARCASDTCFRLETFGNQDSTPVAYSTWNCRRNALIQVFSMVIVQRIELRLFYLSRTVVVARCASDTCFRSEAFENQNSTTVAYLTWYCRRNTSIQLFCMVIVLRIELRLFYLSRTVVVARCACGTRIVQKRSRISVPPPLHTQHGNVDEIPQYRAVVSVRYASDTCLRLEAFENKHSTTVTYSTWDYRRNTSIQVCSIVKVLRIELRLFYHSRTVVVARCACGTRNVQKRSRISVPPPLHTQHGNVDEITQYRTVVVARCASDTCFRLEAFENKHSTTVTYSTWDYSRNGSIQMLSIVLVLRIVLRLFCLSRTGIEARCASDTCFRLETFGNQDSTPVAYSTWNCRRNALIQVFSMVIVQRIELRLFYLSRTVVVARCASDTCFRSEAFENQNSTTVAYSTWDYRRNTSIQVCSIVKVLRIVLRLFYHSRTVVVARCASDTCFRLVAFGNQHSTAVACLTWYNSRNAAPLVFPVVVVLTTELRLFYRSRTVDVAMYVSDTCFRLVSFGNQHSTTVAC
ncbi:hypothetical protein ANTQUA_LOCUS10563 [Anthophora quadrimaculata]